MRQQQPGISQQLLHGLLGKFQHQEHISCNAKLYKGPLLLDFMLWWIKVSSTFRNYTFSYSLSIKRFYKRALSFSRVYPLDINSSYGIAITRRLAIVDRLLKFGTHVPQYYIFCNSNRETLDHLFFSYIVTKNLWIRSLKWIRI